MFDWIDKEIKVLNSNINDVTNNRRARKLKTVLLIFGILITLAGAACLILSLSFIISAFHVNLETIKQVGFISSKTIVGFVLLPSSGVLIVIGCSLIFSSMKIAIVNIDQHIKSMLKPNENRCPYCDSINENGSANCKNCGAPIKISKDSSN